MRHNSLPLLMLTIVSTVGCTDIVRVRGPLQLDAAWNQYDRVVVQIRNGDVDVQVVPGSGGVRVRGEKWAGGMTAEAANGLLEEIAVTALHDPADARSLRIAISPAPDDRRSYGANLKVEIPTAVAVELHTSNGQVSARGLVRQVIADTSNGDVILADIAGDVQANTSNGDVTAEGVSGAMRADTSNGNVTCREIGGQCRLDTSNGNIEIVAAKGGITASSSNGWLRVDAMPPADAAILLTTSNGSITANLPASMRGELDLETSNGRIQTDLGPATLNNPVWSKNRIRARLNGGGGGQVVARTSNGSVTLNCR